LENTKPVPSGTPSTARSPSSGGRGLRPRP